MDSVSSQLLLQVFLILLNAVFASAEIAVISFNDMKLQKIADEGNKKAKKLVKLTVDPSNFLGTIQVGITLAGFLASAFAADNFAGSISNLFKGMNLPVPDSVINTFSVIIITVILSFFTLIFGELVPKRIAMKKAESLSLALANFLYFISKICKPVVWFLTQTTNLVLRIFGINPNDEEEEVTAEEIRMMVDIGTEKGTIDQTEKTIIHNIFEFDETTIDEIMVHRTNVDFLWIKDDIETWKQTIMSGNHAKYPVCGETIDEVIGIVKSADIYKAILENNNFSKESLIKPAYFVPEIIKADDLFARMKSTKNHFSVVLDEYGGFSGIVTMSDLLEEIVGDLASDDDNFEEDELIKIGDNKWKIQGSCDLDTINETLHVSLPSEEYNTIAGMILGELGYIPEDNSTPELESYNLKIKVIKISDHRIETVIASVIDTEVNADIEED
ncbi:MAG: hemolysin family protein [Clostridia bacterium]|nr:hemolysin family protein [Clostridia bacterium]